MEEQIKALEARIQELKLQVIEATEPGVSARLMREIVDAQTRIQLMRNPAARDPVQRQPATPAEVRALRSQCDNVRSRILTTQDEEAKAPLYKELEGLQAQLTEIRKAELAAMAEKYGHNRAWWDNLDLNQKSEVLATIMEKADEEDTKDASRMGFCRAMLDLLRNGREIEDRHLSRIRAIAV